MKLINWRIDDLNNRLHSSNRRIDKRFDDTNRRIDDTDRRFDALERWRREKSKAFSAQFVDLRKDVATLAGRVDEVEGMVSAALQAVLGAVVTRRGGRGRGSAVIEQAAFAESGSDED